MMGASDVHMALSAISHDLKERYPDRIGAQVLMGMSLGGFQGFYIAAGAHRLDDSLVDFDRYVLLNPPVTLLFAAQQLDAFYNVPLTFPETQRDEQVIAILQQITQDVANGSSTQEKKISISEEEAQFLIGLSFRVVLHDAIWSSQQRLDTGILKSRLDPLRRAPVSDEILDFSFLEYFHAFVLPCCMERDATIDTGEEMFKLMDARSLTDTLPTDGTIRVFSSVDDFLLTDADRQWLTHTFGEENVTFEETGGHTGSLGRPEVQRKIMDSLEDLRLVLH